MTHKFLTKKRLIRVGLVTALVLILAAIAFSRSLPSRLFDESYSTVLLDRHGMLLGARVAADHQWRFPLGDSIPTRFTQALICFEDKRFYSHPGIRLGSLGRAMVQNLRSRRIVSGGSTLTMQVIRLSRKGRPRTVWEKLVEMTLALRLEMSLSKEEIMKLYCAHAPFGGNVVGLEAASWRYFGCAPAQLSWGETATLAVLPNSPGLIYPGRNHDKLLAKRKRLLTSLRDEGYIDSLTCQIAQEEPLPDRPRPLPSYAYHLLHRAISEGYQGQRLYSTIDIELQKKVQRACERYETILSINAIRNLAVVVLDTRSGACLAYQGNLTPSDQSENGELVDMITAPRSTGSILKPFLYAAMLDEGEILPDQLVEDIPTFIGSFHPENYDRRNEGAVPAGIALARSLNVPAVRMLRTYGVERFHSTLTRLGLSKLPYPASHYGLSLILGGAEGSLWDISGMYASLARQMMYYQENNGFYLSQGIHKPYYLSSLKPAPGTTSTNSFPNASSIWFTLRALARVNRPLEESHWRQFSSSVPISWKTGTSFGYRDAWAIATTPQYVVGVWTGNADGEGRPGLTGVKASAPLLFDILNILSPSRWFDKPYDDMDKVAVCRITGFKAGSFCSEVDTLHTPRNGSRAETCPYHTRIFVDAHSGKRVSSACRSIESMKAVSWFVLPPEVEHYYTLSHPLYKPLPPFVPGCSPADQGEQVLAILYPRQNAKIIVPGPDAKGNVMVVFEATHRDPSAILYWFIDRQYLGATSQFHKLDVMPETGEHTLTITDMDGNTVSCRFYLSGRS